MAIINLRNFYPWYVHDEFVEVSDEVAAELFADKRYEKNHKRSVRRNKVYSLDAEDGTEEMASYCSSDSPETITEVMERYCRLCHALNSLPETQGRRVDAHYIIGISVKKIAEAEGVGERNVRKSISRGLDAMKKVF